MIRLNKHRIQLKKQKSIGKKIQKHAELLL